MASQAASGERPPASGVLFPDVDTLLLDWLQPQGWMQQQYQPYLQAAQQRQQQQHMQRQHQHQHMHQNAQQAAHHPHHYQQQQEADYQQQQQHAYQQHLQGVQGGGNGHPFDPYHLYRMETENARRQQMYLQMQRRQEREDQQQMREKERQEMLQQREDERELKRQKREDDKNTRIAEKQKMQEERDEARRIAAEQRLVEKTRAEIERKNDIESRRIEREEERKSRREDKIREIEERRVARETERVERREEKDRVKQEALRYPIDDQLLMEETKDKSRGHDGTQLFEDWDGKDTTDLLGIWDFLWSFSSLLNSKDDNRTQLPLEVFKEAVDKCDMVTLHIAFGPLVETALATHPFPDAVTYLRYVPINPFTLTEVIRLCLVPLVDYEHVTDLLKDADFHQLKICDRLVVLNSVCDILLDTEQFRELVNGNMEKILQLKKEDRIRKDDRNRAGAETRRLQMLERMGKAPGKEAGAGNSVENASKKAGSKKYGKDAVKKEDGSDEDSDQPDEGDDSDDSSDSDGESASDLDDNDEVASDEEAEAKRQLELEQRRRKKNARVRRSESEKKQGRELERLEEIELLKKTIPLNCRGQLLGVDRWFRRYYYLVGESCKLFRYDGESGQWHYFQSMEEIGLLQSYLNIKGVREKALVRVLDAFSSVLEKSLPQPKSLDGGDEKAGGRAAKSPQESSKVNGCSEVDAKSRRSQRGDTTAAVTTSEVEVIFEESDEPEGDDAEKTENPEFVFPENISTRAHKILASLIRCELCQELLGDDELHCQICHKTFDSNDYSDSKFSSHMRRCDKETKGDKKLATLYTLAPFVSLLKAALFDMESAIPWEAVDIRKYGSRSRETWISTVKFASTSEQLGEALHDLEEVLKRDWLAKWWHDDRFSDVFGDTATNSRIATSVCCLDSAILYERKKAEPKKTVLKKRGKRR